MEYNYIASCFSFHPFIPFHTHTNTHKHTNTHTHTHTHTSKRQKPYLVNGFNRWHKAPACAADISLLILYQEAEQADDTSDFTQ